MEKVQRLFRKEVHLKRGGNGKLIMNEDKFVQKGLSNKAKKEYRANKLNDILNSIDEIEFIKD